MESDKSIESHKRALVLVNMMFGSADDSVIEEKENKDLLK